MRWIEDPDISTLRVGVDDDVLLIGRCEYHCLPAGVLSVRTPSCSCLQGWPGSDCRNGVQYAGLATDGVQVRRSQVSPLVGRLGCAFPSGDPTPNAAEVQQEVRWMRQRPLPAGVFLLCILGFGYWFVMLGGGASGSATQAEQLIRNTTATAPGQPVSGSQVATVHCSENGQSVLARLAS
ncbi:MAG TPA: hypothetical protein VFW26_00830, partial [Gaiellales bacterium]|nr:hypothetical protein [Gaiellales bacterium]